VVVGSAALLLCLLLQLAGGSRGGVPAPILAAGSTDIPSWLGTDLPALLGPLTDLTGAPVVPETAGLRLWIVVTDRECPVCLEELPVIGAMSELTERGRISAVTVALGDRLEARRTLLGRETGMATFVAGSLAAAEALEYFAAAATPLRILTWYGRVIDRSLFDLRDPVGRMRLLKMVDRWSGG
jgi:hypothetical protein